MVPDDLYGGLCHYSLFTLGLMCRTGTLLAGVANLPVFFLISFELTLFPPAL